MLAFRRGRAGRAKACRWNVLQSYMLPEGELAYSRRAKARKRFGRRGCSVWALFWLEVTDKSPPIDRGTFQQMIAYELVNLPQKGTEAVRRMGRPDVRRRKRSIWLRGYSRLAAAPHHDIPLRAPTQRRPNLENDIKKRRAPLLAQNATLVPPSRQDVSVHGLGAMHPLASVREERTHRGSSNRRIPAQGDRRSRSAARVHQPAGCLRL